MDAKIAGFIHAMMRILQDIYLSLQKQFRKEIYEEDNE